jgi:hypothetical protein
MKFFLKKNYFCNKRVFDNEVYKYNKDFSSKFREDPEYQFLYDNNLINLLNLMFIIKKTFEKIVFIGPNPDTFLRKIPSSIIIIL